MSTEMLMKNRERFIKNVNSNENGAAALSLRLFCSEDGLLLMPTV